MVWNRALIYKNPPIGYPIPGKDLEIEGRELDLGRELDDGSVITKNLYLSLDPYQRVLMKDPNDTSYKSAFPLGQPITGRGIGEVIKSRNDLYQTGDLIRHTLPIEEYTLFSENSITGAEKLNVPPNLDLKLLLGALDLAGLTAYSSFYEIGKPHKGEVILISGAGGAVGQLVGQLARREGLTVYGSVGSDEKLQFLISELGFNGGFNYKKEKPFDAMKRLAPDGFDIYYDNVGGEQLDAALLNMKLFGRVVACGMISTYNRKPEDKYRIANLMEVIFRRLTMRGFQVTDSEMGGKYAKEHQENVQRWIEAGVIQAPMTVTDGIDKAIDGFLGMLKGENNGKAILKLADLQ